MRLTLLALVLALAAPPVAVSVSHRIVQPGTDLRITCRVQRHEDNRGLLIGLSEWTTSSRQLEGASAPITHQLTFRSVPCYPGEPYCLLERTSGRQIRVSTSIEMVGCNESH